MNPDQSQFWKPKFHIAAYILIVSTIALFTGRLSEGTFQALAVMIFSGFAAASVVENKLLK